MNTKTKRTEPNSDSLIYPVETINGLTIYQRERTRPRGVPLYVVYTPDDRALEEFGRMRNAKIFCNQTTDFITAE
jgi:hypothetical protein